LLPSLKIDLHLQGIEKFVEGGKKLHDAEGLYDLCIRLASVPRFSASIVSILAIFRSPLLFLTS